MTWRVDFNDGDPRAWCEDCGAEVPLHPLTSLFHACPEKPQDASGGQEESAG